MGEQQRYAPPRFTWHYGAMGTLPPALKCHETGAALSVCTLVGDLPTYRPGSSRTFRMKQGGRGSESGLVRVLAFRDAGCGAVDMKHLALILVALYLLLTGCIVTYR